MDTNRSSNSSQKTKHRDIWKRKKEERNLASDGPCRPSGKQMETQRKRKERQVLGACQKTKKALEHEGNRDTNCNWRTWNGLQRLGKVKGWIRWKLVDKLKSSKLQLKSARILRNVLETWGVLQSLRLQ